MNRNDEETYKKNYKKIKKLINNGYEPMFISLDWIIKCCIIKPIYIQ